MTRSPFFGSKYLQPGSTLTILACKGSTRIFILMSCPINQGQNTDIQGDTFNKDTMQACHYCWSSQQISHHMFSSRIWSGVLIGALMVDLPTIASHTTLSGSIVVSSRNYCLGQKLLLIIDQLGQDYLWLNQITSPPPHATKPLLVRKRGRGCSGSLLVFIDQVSLDVTLSEGPRHLH
jgi:hypothetical protein